MMLAQGRGRAEAAASNAADALPCRVYAACVQAVAATNEKLASGLFRLPGKKVQTTIEPATDYYLAEVWRGSRGCVLSAEQLPRSSICV